VRIVDNTGAPVAGYSYDPYGTLRASTGTSGGDTTITTANPLRYTAGYRDDSGLYKLGLRYYDATLGRFSQPDPTGQEHNPYAYAGLNPINNTDLSGASFLGGVLGDVSDALDLQDTVVDAVNGDLKGELDDAAGIVTGIGTDVACNFVLGALDEPTGGLATAVGEDGCTYASVKAAGAVKDRLKESNDE
jgi:RHS repeat-associated protein